MKYFFSYAFKFFTFIVPFVTYSYAASFDCAKAGTKVEKLICSTPSLSKLDSDLADIYKDALRKEPATRQEQVSWIKDRNKCADAACLETSYKERMDELTNFIVRADRNALAVPDKNKQASTTLPSNSSQDKLDRAYSIGVCMGAISIAKQRLGDNTTFFKYYNKFKSTILNYEEIIGQPCLSNMTKTCFEKLPDEAKLYFNGLAGSRKELSSPSPVTILNNNRIGTDRSTLITAIAGYCEQ